MAKGIEKGADVLGSRTDVGENGADGGESAGAAVKGALFRKRCPECGQGFADGSVNCPADGTQLIAGAGDPLIGKALSDRYEVVALVGCGGMSAVYRGRHRTIGRPVAIKVMHSDHLRDPLSVRRFHQEAEAASYLNHPNLITVFDFGVLPDGPPYLIMDFVDGVSLAHLLLKHRRIDADRLIPIVIQVCTGVAHAHQRGVIHRDLKPSNIMVTDIGDHQDFVKVVDFGIATFLPDVGRQRQKLTHTGQVLGSFPYLSPEQCLGKKVDCRSDIYSLGCLMYEAGCPRRS